MEWIEGLAILVTVVAIVTVTSFYDWTKERQFRGLQRKHDAEQRVSVLRDRCIVHVPTSDLLVGDVCQLTYGHIVPADGIVVDAHDLLVDESSLTGESKLIAKRADRRPMLFAGTRVMEGRTSMLVTAVGKHTQAGIIMTLLVGGQSGDVKSKTPYRQDE